MAVPPTQEERDALLRLYVECGGNRAEIGRRMGRARETVRNWVRDLDLDNRDFEIIGETVRIAKQRQGLQDRNRIQNKAFREHARIENAVSGYTETLCELLATHGITRPEPPAPLPAGPSVGVLQLTDIHFNEAVELAQNRYNFEIAGQRLKKLVDEACIVWKAKGVSTVLAAFTGDLMNSDRRLDELLANQDNRARATLGGVDILRQLFEDLVSRGFRVVAADSNGNEGRCTKEVGWIDKVASDNYDETICRMLEYIFKAHPRVEWAPRSDATECVVEVAGHNWLLIHGHQFTKDLEASVSKTVSKYAKRGIFIRYVISGHIHSGYLNENFGRPPSPVGDNAYSDKALNLTGRAGGAFYTAEPDGSVHASLVDLQNVQGRDGYSALEAYQAHNSKSEVKARGEGTPIFQVTI